MAGKIFVSADHHHHHKNICGPRLSSWSKGYRNFDSLEQMSGVIFKNLNDAVGVEDTLIFAGDFAFGDKQAIPALFERIVCANIVFLYGNHDTWIRKSDHSNWHATGMRKIQWTGDYYELRLPNKPLVVIGHYPLSVWNERARGAINLHGHSHCGHKPIGRQKDIGVDCNFFKPHLLDDLFDELLALPVGEARDHHDSTVTGW